MSAWLVGYVSKADLKLKLVRVCSCNAANLEADHSRWILVDVLSWPSGGSFYESRKALLDFISDNPFYAWVDRLAEQVPL